MKFLFNIIKLIVIAVVIFFGLQFEYEGRKVKTYITEFPNSIIALRAKYYIMSIITGKKDPEKEKKLFDTKENKTTKEKPVDEIESTKLKSLIINN